MTQHSHARLFKLAGKNAENSPLLLHSTKKTILTKQAKVASSRYRATNDSANCDAIGVTLMCSICIGR